MTESIMTQAAAEIRTINLQPRRRAIEEERDHLDGKRAGLAVDIATTTGTINDLNKLKAEIDQAIRKKTRERAELVNAYESSTTTLRNLDIEAMRLGMED